MDDQDYLDMLNTMINYKDKPFVIPGHMKEGIRQGAEYIKNGDFYTMEDFEKKYEKWLKEWGFPLFNRAAWKQTNLCAPLKLKSLSLHTCQ